MITEKQFNENATPTTTDAKLRKGDVIRSVCVGRINELKLKI